MYLKSTFFALVFFVTLFGCHRRIEERLSLQGQEQIGKVVVILLDMSGSYADMMGSDGRAYKFALRVVDQYFRDNIGSNDRIIIAQISGTEKALLWEGTPTQLRQSFPSADDFRNFLLSKSNPGGSRVHSGLGDAIDYVRAYPGVADGTTLSAVLVLSDMLDNAPDSEKSKQELLQSLAEYGGKGGAVGLYWVDHTLLAEWRGHLQKAGFKHFIVESEIVASPPLPVIE